MTARTSYQSGYCMSYAAAGTSARVIEILGIAVLAVSVLLLGLAVLQIV